MKIGIYSPYIPQQLGGGEKYIFDVARMCVELGHEVSILLDTSSSEDIVEKYEKFLGVSLAGIQFVTSPIGRSSSFWKKLLYTKQFDAMYLVTDGSLFLSLAPKNILHIQIPFTASKVGILERVKLSNWSVKNANSSFTKHIVEKAWQTRIQFVHHPMIDLPQAKYNPKQKEKIIISVGRFFDHLHSKRQDVLVSTFKELLAEFPKETSGWKLVLVGPAEDKMYAEKIAIQAKNFPIEIIHSASRKELDELYAKATFYWHAAGYEVDEHVHPEKVEHFGISTVESMNFGCVPIVVGKGGQVEVLGEKLADLLWQTPQQAVGITMKLITDKDQREAYAELAVKQSKNFNKEKFVMILKEMLR